MGVQDYRRYVAGGSGLLQPVVYWLWLLLKHSGHVLPAVVSSKLAFDMDSGVCPDRGWARRTESARFEVAWNTTMNTTGMEHYIYMYQSMRKTRSRLQGSTRLLAATKARASPNQLNNFNASARKSQILQLHSPPVSNAYAYMISALPPALTLIGFSTLLFVQPLIWWQAEPYLAAQFPLRGVPNSPSWWTSRSSWSMFRGWAIIGQHRTTPEI